MPTRDENIRVSISRGRIDPEVSSLLSQLNGQKERAVSVNVRASNRNQSEPSTSLTRQPAETKVSVVADTSAFEKKLSSALSRAKTDIDAFNKTAVVKLTVDDS